MEFDVVILADANDETYPPDELSLRLLYVSLTRAVHSLHIVFVGKLTTWLDAQQATVTLQPFLGRAVEPQPITIRTFAEKHEVDPDWCIERLASADRLWLLEQGEIDETLLEVALAGDTAIRRASRELDEEKLSVFGSEVESKIRSALNGWNEQEDPNLQKGLALAQLAYALFRPHIRNMRLIPASQVESELSDQILALATFRQILHNIGASVPPGQWLTKTQLIRTVTEHRQTTARQLIQTMLQNGLLEELSADPTRSRVRLSPDYTESFLLRSLGDVPVTWEPELLQSIPNVNELAQLITVKDQ